MNAIKSLHIRLTTRCNMRCAHCYAAGWQSRYPEIESRHFIAAIEEAQKLNCTEITLTGGEPLVYSEIEAVLRFIYSQGLKLKLETNGLALEGFFPWLEKFGDRALQSRNRVRIAGRCTVFAETAMIHKQQLGYETEDIIAGLCDSLVKNYLNNVSRGKEILPPVVFQGGVAANKGTCVRS